MSLSTPLATLPGPHLSGTRPHFSLDVRPHLRENLTKFLLTGDKIMTSTIIRFLGCTACALLLICAAASPQAAAAPSEPIKLAATQGAAPVEPPAKYEETMQEAMNKVMTTMGEIMAAEGLSLEEKEQRAMEFIRNYRWGVDGKNYFWVNNLQGRMLMHPTNPQLENKIVTNLRDADGKPIFVEFIGKCLETGGGFVDYLWPDPTGEAPVPKTSLVQLFKPFGWVVGTGLYLETIEPYEEPIEPGFFLPPPEDFPIDDRDPASPV